MHPWAFYVLNILRDTLLMEGDEDLMSDMMFLAQKEKDGKLVTDTDVQDDGATGDAAILTASSGKDLYLAEASVNFTVDALTVTIITAEVTLKANGVIKDRFTYAFIGSATSASAHLTKNHKFAVKGVKVAATETITIDVISSDADIDIEGTLIGFEETTGADPRLAAQTQGVATITGGIAGSLGFIAKKDFDGKFVQAHGSRASGSGDGEVVAYTPASGKFFYLVGARVESKSPSGTMEVDCTLENNTTERQLIHIGTSEGNQTFTDNYPDHLDGTGALKYSIEADFDGGTGAKTIQGLIWGYIEDDADDPTS